MTTKADNSATRPVMLTEEERRMIAHALRLYRTELRATAHYSDSLNEARSFLRDARRALALAKKFEEAALG